MLKASFEELLLGLSVVCLRKAASQRSFEEMLLGLPVLCLRRAAYSKIFRGNVLRPIRPMPKKGGVLKDFSRSCC